MAHVGVVLAGCGYLDGAEIHEATMTLLALQQAGATYEGLAPNRNQHHVINHVDQSEQSGERNILQEAARIMRGNIKSLMNADLEDYDALIFPGGNGAAKNLFNLALAGADYQVEKDVLAFGRDAVEMGLPMGFICIAPMMMPFFYPQGVQMTIGNDADMAKIAQSKGAKHVNCAADDIVIDDRHKAVSTPAYMLAEHIGQVHEGVSKLVKAVLGLA